jgi:hypothetical protein
MQFRNRLPCDPSYTLAADRLAGNASRLRISAESSRSIVAVTSDAASKAIGRLAARGEAAFERFLLAMMSRTIAQVLAGCARYCEATYLYPSFVEPVEAVDGHEAADGPQSRGIPTSEEEIRARAAVALVRVETSTRAETVGPVLSAGAHRSRRRLRSSGLGCHQRERGGWS